MLLSKDKIEKVVESLAITPVGADGKYLQS